MSVAGRDVTTPPAAADPPGEHPSSREAILAAAERLMSTVGYGKTSIAAICRESGLPVGSVYHHFGSKVGLLSAVMDRWASRFFTQLPRYRSGTADPVAEFRAYWDGAIDGVVRHRALFMLDGHLRQLGHHDAEVGQAIRQVRARSGQRLAPTFRAFTDDLGLAPADADRLSRRLASVIEISTFGAVLTHGSDLPALRSAMEDLHLVVVSTAVLAAGTDPRTQPRS